MKGIKRNKGITLIALIITIIILLILAGIVILMLNGENSILKRTQEARERTREAADKEAQDLAKLNEWIDSFIGDYDGIKLNFNGYTPGAWTNEDITINLLMKNQQGEKYQYSNDKSTWIDCGSVIKINNDQEKTYYFRRVDSNGKLICETQGFEIKRDTEKPTFDVDFSSTSDSITCKIANIKDIGSGVGDNPQISISYRKETDSQYINAFTGTTNEYTMTGMGEMFKNVIYVIKISVTDIANNKTDVIKRIETKSAEAQKELKANGYTINLSLDNDSWTEDWLEILYSSNYTIQDIINKCKEEGKNESVESLNDYKTYTSATSFYEFDVDENAERIDTGLWRIELEMPNIEENTTYYILSYNSESQEFEIIEPESLDVKNKILTFCISDENLGTVSIIKK